MMKKAYFSRAMDCFDFSEIAAQYKKMEEIFVKCGLEIANPFDETNFVQVNEKCSNQYMNEGSKIIVEKDLEILKRADFLIADLSIKNHFYFGCICEIVYAHLWHKPVIVFTGDSNNSARLWMYHHANYVCKTLDEVIDILKAIT
jgi:nucleoside 2-deoxyribosyltransferase